MKKIIFLFTLILLSNPVYPRDQVISGVGSSTCAEWMTLRKFNDKDANLILETWLRGFLSGMNILRNLQNKEVKYVRLPSVYTMHAYIDKACEEDQLQYVFGISAKLYFDLAKQQGIEISTRFQN